MPNSEPSNKNETTSQPKKKRTRYVSEEERKKRAKQLEKARKAKKAKAKLRMENEYKKILTEQNSGKVRTDRRVHDKSIRKDNFHIKIPYAPLSHQYRLTRALDSGRRFVALVGGRQCGKTYAGARECLRRIYTGKRSQGMGWIVAPTYPMSVVAEREFERAAGTGLILNKRVGAREYVLRPQKAGDAPYLVQVKSAEHPDRLRGGRCDWIWIDEAAMVSSEAIDILYGVVLASGGKIFATTTPRGLANWVYEDWFKRAENNDRNYSVIRAQTADNLHLSRDAILSMEEKYSAEFARQELLGEFVSFEGLVYKDFDRQKHIVELSEIQEQVEGPNAEFIAGVDWGYADPFVFLWIAKYHDKYYIVDEYYKQGEIPADHLAQIKKRFFTSRVRQVFADVSRPESRIEFQRGLGIPVLPGRVARKDMVDGIEHVASLFKFNKLFVASHCRNTIDELGKYSWAEKKDRNVEDRPCDFANHAMDALRYALFSDKNRGPASSKVRLPDGRTMVSRGRSRSEKESLIRKIIREDSEAKRRALRAKDNTGGFPRWYAY